LKGHSNRIWSLAYASDGSYLVSGGEDATVRVWDLEPNSQTFVLKGHYYRIYSVAVNPVNGMIASGGADRTVRLWERDRTDPVRTFTEHTGRVMCVAFNPTGDLLASASEDHTIRLWRLGEGGASPDRYPGQLMPSKATSRSARVRRSRALACWSPGSMWSYSRFIRMCLRQPATS
jgi:WD40 repeat protein